MQIPENWKDETVAGVSTMLTDPTGNAAVVFIEVGKEDLIEGITLEEVMDSVKEYSYSMYKPEKEAGEPSSCKVGNYNAYKTSYNTTYTGYKFKLTAYAVETDGYFVQLYTLALSSKAEENEKIFEEILKTIEEVK